MKLNKNQKKYNHKKNKQKNTNKISQVTIDKNNTLLKKSLEQEILFETFKLKVE